jgi:hypothetical protein
MPPVRRRQFARSLWPVDHRTPVRVITESHLGLSNARATGLAEARYEYISFVDDDNWVTDGRGWTTQTDELIEEEPTSRGIPAWDVGSLIDMWR